MEKVKNKFFVDKKVELSELFFDLIFVYAVSKISHTILHLHHGSVSTTLFLEYTIMLLVFVSVWSYQTFFTNRFGMSKFRDISFMMFNMFIIIYLSNSINPNFDKTFEVFFLCTGILFLSVSLQYFIVFNENIIKKEKDVCLVFGITTLICSVIIFSAYFIPGTTHYIVFYIAIFIGLLGPVVGMKWLRKSPVNMPHLIERYSLFTIIMFGESMVGLTSIFNIEKFEVISIFQFIIVASLFWTYWIKIDFFMNQNNKATGLRLCYTHIIIFFSLGLLNSGIIFSENDSINYIFEATLIYASILLFYLGILLNMAYYHQVYQMKKLYIGVLGIVFIFFMFNILFINLQWVLILTTAICAIIILSIFMRVKIVQEYKKEGNRGTEPSK